MKPVLAVTIGDINGIGPEIILKSITTDFLSHSDVILVGPNSAFCYYSDQNRFPVSNHADELRDLLKKHSVVIYDNFGTEIIPTPGKISSKSGQIAMRALESAIHLITGGHADALVTAPISKEAIHMAGFNYPGHTEYLQEATSSHDVVMMLVSGGLRVALVTSHIPVSQIALNINEDRIIKCVHTVNKALINEFQLKKPKIAILGLNPHAGDGGILGREEIEIIEPAIQLLKQHGIDCNGPFAADGWFAMAQYENFDAVIAMYHDQGLAPFKALSFGRGVNFTAGLPIIRTSPDHGTAFSIAGKNMAKPDSMFQALDLAKNITTLRVKKHQ